MNRVVFHDIQTHFGFETGIKTDLFETYNYGNFFLPKFNSHVKVKKFPKYILTS